MSQEEDHPIAGGVFLLVVAAAIGFGGKAGIEHSAHTALEHELEEAAKAEEAGQPATAAAILREVLRKSPESTSVMFNLGLTSLELDQDDAADEMFSKVLERKPDDYEAMACRALIMKRKGKVDEALTLLQKIPVGQGRLQEMLQTESAWQDLDGDPRMAELKKKHGL
jgi:tetratricopeptide (TPR) repeat protein